MKTIGLLGGMSWESTGLYYRKINEATKLALGGLHSAPIAMVSVDFAEIERLQHAGDWPACAELLWHEPSGFRPTPTHGRPLVPRCRGAAPMHEHGLPGSQQRRPQEWLFELAQTSCWPCRT